MKRTGIRAVVLETAIVNAGHALHAGEVVEVIGHFTTREYQVLTDTRVICSLPSRLIEIIREQPRKKLRKNRTSKS